MRLVEVPYAAVAAYRVAAAREGVSVSPTSGTQWYAPEGGEGFCALMTTARGVRIKGVFVHPEWRGRGIGTQMTEALLRIAQVRSDGVVEVLAYNAAFYEERGFRRVSQRPNGAWRLERSVVG